MKENTFTYTARSVSDPEKMATFTLHNGSVSVELGNAFIQQVDEAFTTFRDDASSNKLTAWIRPATTGTLQSLIEPIPLGDFDAEIRDGALQTTAWIRAGGLRLAPMMMTWSEVDNREGARAFVNELHGRKEALRETQGSPDPLDYWASWVALGLVILILPVLFIRMWNKRRAS